VGLLVVFGAIGVLAGPSPTSTVKPTVTLAAATVTAATEATLPPTTTPPTTARPTTTQPASTAPRTTRPAPPPLRVTIVSLPATGQGNPATATVRTAPDAKCTIDVEYKSGPSHAAGLGPKTASSSGAVSWTWLVGTRTTPGAWPVTVTCSTGSASESDERDLTVLDTGKPG
jgi:micrococcal nuclease